MTSKKRTVTPLVKEIEDAFWELSKKMEKNQLTGIKLAFTNGWHLSLSNQRAHRRLMQDEKPFRTKTKATADVQVRR